MLSFTIIYYSLSYLLFTIIYYHLLFTIIFTICYHLLSFTIYYHIYYLLSFTIHYHIYYLLSFTIYYHIYYLLSFSLIHHDKAETRNNFVHYIQLIFPFSVEQISGLVQFVHSDNILSQVTQIFNEIYTLGTACLSSLVSSFLHKICLIPQQAAGLGVNQRGTFSAPAVYPTRKISS